jgi:hypothetical protein
MTPLEVILVELNNLSIFNEDFQQSVNKTKDISMEIKVE